MVLAAMVLFEAGLICPTMTVDAVSKHPMGTANGSCRPLGSKVLGP